VERLLLTPRIADSEAWDSGVGAGGRFVYRHVCNMRNHIVGFPPVPIKVLVGSDWLLLVPLG
jgi:hypothetical protein